MWILSFLFSETGCHTKVKDHSLPYYFTHSWRENSLMHAFPKWFSAIWNTNSRVQDLNSGYHIYQPLRSGRIWHKVKFFKRSLTGLNSEFSFS